MPRVKALGLYGEKNKRFFDVVEAGMKMSRTDYKKLMEKSQRSPATYYKRKREPESMTVSELRAFIRTLGISEEEVLDFLYDKRKEWKNELHRIFIVYVRCRRNGQP